MADEPTAGANAGTNDIQFVDANTDDLDAFTNLLNGKAQVKEEPDEPVETKEEVKQDEPVVEPPEGDEDGADDNPDEGVKDEPDDKPAPKKNRFQERIDELTAKARDYERRFRELEAKQGGNATPPPAPVTPKEETPPKADAKNDDGSDKYALGEFDPAYIRDLARFEIQKETKAAREQEANERVQRQQQEARDELQKQWAGRLTEATAKHDDFVAKTMELETTFEGLDPNYSDYLVQTVKSLDHGPEVLYHFANNLDEARAFVNLGPLQATLALGELNARFKKGAEAPKPTPAKVSTAPTPPPVLNKGGTPRAKVEADTDDLDAFSKMLFAKKKRR